MAPSNNDKERTEQAPPSFWPRHRQMQAEVKRARDVRGTVWRLWTYLRRQHRALIMTMVLVMGSTALRVLEPYLLGVVIDRYIIPGDLSGLARMVLLMLAVYGAMSLLTWLQSYVMAGASQRMVRDLRNDLFQRLQSLSLRFFDQRPRGELMSRLTNDVENINMVLSESMAQLISGVLAMVGIAAIMVVLNWRLALVSLTFIPLLTLLLMRLIAPQTRSGFRRQQATLGDLNGIIEETIGGQRVVKAYVREEAVLAHFATANQAYRHAAVRAQFFAGIIGPTMNLIGNSETALLATVGGWMALQGWVTVGTIASFIKYSREFGRPMTEVANLYNAIQGAIAGAERVFEIIDHEPELVDAPNARSLTTVRGEVRFEDVSFAYSEGVPVLRQVTFHAEPGQTIALVGPTGAGKTTIVNLLSRFYDIDQGCITIDGVDIRQVRKDDLRRRLGIVLQDTYLFADTLMENIRYGRLDATDEEVVAAAQTANAGQFIHRLPQGYATQLAERGSNLSQGQRQLLSIARAILADPEILILDEATSSVDTRTEKQIQEAMLQLMAGRTSFVIAHRLSTIRDADLILVIDQGQIVEQGRHQELLNSRGFYHKLYQSQFGATGNGPNGRVNGTTPAPIADD